DLIDAKMVKTTFDSCKLDSMNLTGTLLKKVDISTCHFIHLPLSIETISGSIVNEHQALILARDLLKVKIK
ncbi:hypothetical protein, partial [Enterococcus faecalis]|uniref:hypothetical protein n=1 Tax=Enterococcus faecalis TaxID=1351 RepID=UPI003D6A9A35